MDANFNLPWHAICKKYTYNHVHDATLLQTIPTELAGADRVRALKDAPAPNAGTAHSVANSVTSLNSSMMNINRTQTTPNQHTVLAQTAFHPRRGASHTNARTRKPRSQSLAEKRRKRRTRMMSQRRIHALIARNTTARSPIMSSRTNACETRNIRDTTSS